MIPLFIDLLIAVLASGLNCFNNVCSFSNEKSTTLEISLLDIQIHV